jgi:hypothetical protein
MIKQRLQKWLGIQTIYERLARLDKKPTPKHYSSGESDMWPEVKVITKKGK